MAAEANEEPAASSAAAALMPKAPDPAAALLPTKFTVAVDMLLNMAACTAAATAAKEEAEFTETTAEAVAAPLGSKMAEDWALNSAA